jgi:hypothetical protein
MKKLLVVILALGPISAFANCKILLHKSVEVSTHGALQEVLKNSKISRFVKGPDFGVKELIKNFNSGDKDIFGEDVMIKKSSLALFENGQSILETGFNSDKSLLAQEIAAKLNLLRCN